jgi:hypothetical protein
MVLVFSESSLICVHGRFKKVWENRLPLRYKEYRKGGKKNQILFGVKNTFKG